MSLAAPARAQTATFSDITDAAIGSAFDPAATVVDPDNANRLIVGFHSGVNSQTWTNTAFRASTAAFYRTAVTDTLCVLVSAEAGYYVSAITYQQSGSGSIVRTGKAAGVTSFAVNGAAHPAQGFATNPSLARLTDLTGQGLTSVPFCVTTSLFVFSTPQLGSASLAVDAAELVVELLPLP
jgi:hypothetical protein